jgi:hypothetical protein
MLQLFGDTAMRLFLCVAVISLPIAMLKAEDAPAAPDIGALVKKLASADYDERDTAGRELGLLGTEALPALKDHLATLEKQPDSTEETRLLKGAIHNIRQTAFKKELEPIVEARTAALADLREAIEAEKKKMQARIDIIDNQLPDFGARIHKLRKKIDDDPEALAKIQPALNELQTTQDTLRAEMMDLRQQVGSTPKELGNRLRFARKEIELLKELINVESIAESVLEIEPVKIKDWTMTPVGLNVALGRKMTLQFIDTPAEESINFVSELLSVRLVHQDVEGVCNISSQGSCAKDVLDEICKQTGSTLTIDKEKCQIVISGHPVDDEKH